MKLIHNGDPNRTLAMMIETYEPGTTTGERIKHQGEEIGTLLEGEVVLQVNGQSYHLLAGQSYAINTGIPTVSATRRRAFAGLSAPIRRRHSDQRSGHELSPFAVLATTGAGPED